MSEPRRTPDGGRIISELFTDAAGWPVERDSPELAAIEVEVLYPDGTTERTYLRAEGGR